MQAIKTSPWASAIRSERQEDFTYPSLPGMEVMLITPNDFYRKKLMGLGIPYIATALRRCDITVKTLNCEIWAYDDIEIAKRVIESGIKIFGIGGLYGQFQEINRICNIIRSVVSDATIIIGGALPSPIPEFALRKSGADIATIGEAELTVPSLMAALAGEKELADVRGIAYLKDGEFFDTGKPELPRQVTKKEVGWPAWDLFPIDEYMRAPKFYPFLESDRVLTVNSGRGCPYACDFCYRVNAYRIRPFDDILDEMEYLIDRYKLNGVYFVDDLLMLSKKKVQGICEGIIDRKLNIKFNISGRVNIVTPEIVDMLKEAGCVSVYYGIESGNEDILKTMSKKTNLQQVTEAVQLTRSRGIYCEYGIMFGQPGEDEKTLKDSVDLVKKLSYGEYRVQKLFGCVPFPGTGLYDWCKATGRIKSDEQFFQKYHCQDWSLDQIPVNMTDLDDCDVEKMFREANHELSQFFVEKIAKDWKAQFGSASGGSDQPNISSMKHIFDRVEATMNTQDTSGRSG